MVDDLTPDELPDEFLRAIRACPADNIAEIVERIMGLAAEDLAAGRFGDADSALAVASFMAAARPDVPPAP